MNFKNFNINDNEFIETVMKFNTVFDAIDFDFRSISSRNLVVTIITIESLNQILMTIVNSFVPSSSNAIVLIFCFLYCILGFKYEYIVDAEAAAVQTC